MVVGAVRIGVCGVADHALWALDGSGQSEQAHAAPGQLPDGVEVLRGHIRLTPQQAATMPPQLLLYSMQGRLAPRWFAPARSLLACAEATPLMRERAAGVVAGDPDRVEDRWAVDRMALPPITWPSIGDGICGDLARAAIGGDLASALVLADRLEEQESPGVGWWRALSSVMVTPEGVA